jgi:hypothetical protein
MKKFFILFLFFIFPLSNLLFSQQIPGAAKGAKPEMNKISRTNSIPLISKVSNAFIYTTTTYTFQDLVVFSYSNNSSFLILDNMGTHIDSVILNENEYHVFSPGAGIYRVEGSNSFTLLVGDPVSNWVLGYFAVDETGRPLSTRLNTYMPDNPLGGEYFIIFAYTDNTEFTLKNLATNEVIASGILNRGEHYQLSGYYNIFIGVFATKPVSALSYTDQGYFIPADNGTFAGTHFYGFSGYVGGWPNGIIITAYHDATEYLIINSLSEETIASGTLNTGEVFADSVFTDTYWEVTTNKNVTVSNTPYAYYDYDYYYLTRQIDESGMGIGTNFYCTTTGLGIFINSDVNIFSYEDNNTISITDMTPDTLVWTGILNEGEYYYLSPPNKTIYHVTGTNNISVISSAGGSAGADFMPLNFTVGLPDLAISGDDISFIPDVETRNPGDPIYISATVHNYGFSDATGVIARFYDGDPDGGLTIGTRFIGSIAANSSYTFTMNWNVPTLPEYHAVYVMADPNDDIIESNSSNNVAYKFIIPNDDLLPPLSTTVDAPATLYYYGDSTEFNEFDIRVNLFNSGEITAANASITLHLPDNLSLSNPADTLLLMGDIYASENASDQWHVMINSLSPEEIFFYSILVQADNAPAKLVERMLIVHGPSGIGDQNSSQNIPEKYSLLTNYPNPFNPYTTIEYTVEKSSAVLLEVYDITGQKITTLVNERKNPGVYYTTFTARNLGTGVYILRLKVDDQNIIRKMTLIK